jgi:hypothetical protein
LIFALRAAHRQEEEIEKKHSQQIERSVKARVAAQTQHNWVEHDMAILTV